MHLSTFITRSKAVAMAIMACSFVGSAETFTLETAGTLAELIGDRKYEITELKVVGPISNADIKLIRQMGGYDERAYAETEGKLVDLDLSEATIVANDSDTEGYFYNWTEYFVKDNEVSDFMFKKLKLVTVKLPATATHLGKEAFQNCNALTSVTMPQSITTFGSSVFQNCTSLKSVELPAINEIPSSTFSGCSSLESVAIPQTVKTIGMSAFYGCSSLTALELPAEITSLPSNFCKNCSSLAAITIPSSVTTIGSSAFENCASLTAIDLPEIASLESYAFQGTGLKSITLPATVAALKNRCLNTAAGLTELHCTSATPAEVQYNGLYGINYESCTLYVPEGSKADYMAVADWAAFANIVEGSGSTEPENPAVRVVTVTEPGQLASVVGESYKYAVEDLTITGPLNGSDLCFIRDMAGRSFDQQYTDGKLRRLDIANATLVYQGTYNENGIRVPVESDYYAYLEATIGGDSPIKMAARQDCLPELVFTKTTLEEVVLPTSIKKIYSSFSECFGLKGTVVIPEGVETIGDYAFEGCYNIEHIILPSTLVESSSVRPLANENAICAHAFDGCRSLKSIEIPEVVTNLRDATFQYCSSLTEITLPAKLTNIGAKTFGGCTAIKNIYVKNPDTLVKAYYEAFVSSDENKTGVDKLNCVVTVPVGMKAAYKDADEWFEFLNIIEEGETAQFTVKVNDVENVAVTFGDNQTLSLTAGENTVLSADILNPLTITAAEGYGVEAAVDGVTKTDLSAVAVPAGSVLDIKVSPVSGVEAVKAANFAYNRAGGVISANSTIQIFTTSGVLVATANNTLSTANMPAGIYVAKIGDKAFKFVK